MHKSWKTLVSLAKPQGFLCAPRAPPTAVAQGRGGANPRVSLGKAQRFPCAARARLPPPSPRAGAAQVSLGKAQDCYLYKLRINGPPAATSTRTPHLPQQLHLCCPRSSQHQQILLHRRSHGKQMRRDLTVIAKPVPPWRRPDWTARKPTTKRRTTTGKVRLGGLAWAPLGWPSFGWASWAGWAGWRGLGWAGRLASARLWDRAGLGWAGPGRSRNAKNMSSSWAGPGQVQKKC